MRSSLTGKQFEKAIFETAGRYGWKLRACLMMSSHYHLTTLETPRVNPVEGMRGSRKPCYLSL